MKTQEMINKSQQVHGDTYTYNKYVYVNARTKSIITCKIHGDFLQMPHQHLLGKGCIKCGKISMSNKNRNSVHNFTEKAISVHGNKYNYSNVVYINNNTKVKILCDIHGIFEQTPRDHLSGQGCKLCGLSRMALKQTTSLDNFILKANKVHNNKYLYEHVCFETLQDKVKITCKDHGIFEQQAASHLAGHGCSKCAVKGFDKEKPGILYLVYLNDFNLYKIGITNLTTESRLRGENFTIIKEEMFDLGYDAFIAEQIFIRDNRSFLYKGQNVLKIGGNNELFTYLPEERLQKILDERQ